MDVQSNNDLQRQILDTTRRLLISDGYAHLSMRKIAREIGYSATTIYLHFENKDELVHSLIDEGVSRLHDTLLACSSDFKAEPASRLEKLCKHYVMFGLSNPEYYEIMYMLHPVQMSRYPVVRYRRARQNLQILSSTYSDGVENGTFQDIDPMLAASIIWSNMHGVVSLLLSERFDSRISRDIIVSESINRILNGLKLTPVLEANKA